MKKSINNFFDKIKEKNAYSIIIIVIAFGIILMISGNKNTQSKTQLNNEKTNNQIVTLEEKGNDDNASEKIEKELEEILSNIGGAGEVKVMLNFQSQGEKIFAMNTIKEDSITNEQDNSGGIRTVNSVKNQEEIVMGDYENSNRKPVVAEEKFPVAYGAIIVAEGAENIEVQEKLFKAVQALLDIPYHRIQVFDMKN